MYFVAFKLDASSVQQHESCIFEAEYWNMLLDIKLLNLINLEDLAELSEGWGSTLLFLKACLTP